MERKEYEMTEAELNEIRNAYRQDTDAVVSAWRKVGIRLGFDTGTALAVPGKSDCFFTAVPVVQAIEMVRVPTSEVVRLIAVAAVLDDKWPESVRGMVNHLSPAMCDRIREVGVRLIGLADGVERRDRLGL